jgi:hypothetical protein
MNKCQYCPLLNSPAKCIGVKHKAFCETYEPNGRMRAALLSWMTEAIAMFRFELLGEPLPKGCGGCGNKADGPPPDPSKRRRFNAYEDVPANERRWWPF